WEYLAGADQRDGTRPELRRIGTRHDCQPFLKDCQLATRAGTQDVGQVSCVECCLVSDGTALSEAEVTTSGVVAVESAERVEAGLAFAGPRLAALKRLAERLAEAAPAGARQNTDA
ncbi:hypothetical protein, partial [Streptomyces sp. NPDC056453]|uniref:hypothetical protein n=1 Tax=Streptomyces sp. NPDC056453 TaxID=3345822 RepID=UPI00368D988A